MIIIVENKPVDFEYEAAITIVNDEYNKTKLRSCKLMPNDLSLSS